MKFGYVIYVIACVLFILLSIIDKIYPIGRLLLGILYFSTWGILLFIELKKMLAIKKRVGKHEGYFSLIAIFLMLIVCIVDMLR